MNMVKILSMIAFFLISLSSDYKLKSADIENQKSKKQQYKDVEDVIESFISYIIRYQKTLLGGKKKFGNKLSIEYDDEKLLEHFEKHLDMDYIIFDMPNIDAFSDIQKQRFKNILIRFIIKISLIYMAMDQYSNLVVSMIAAKDDKTGMGLTFYSQVVDRMSNNNMRVDWYMTNDFKKNKILIRDIIIGDRMSRVSFLDVLKDIVREKMFLSRKRGLESFLKSLEIELVS